MYIRNKLIKILKIKNIILLIAAIFNITVSTGIIISLILTYHDQLHTFLEAKATPDSIKSIIIGIVLLVLACISRRFIGNANFYYSYFESDLDGYIKFEDLSEVTGKKELNIKLQLIIFRKIYMKNYSIQYVNSIKQIVLNSKKYKCECKNCGALIEKRVYFTGICPYCGSSNLCAKVLTNNRFYSIENNASNNINKKDFYCSKHLNKKKVLLSVVLCLSLIFMLISAIAIIDNIYKYNSKSYLTEVLLSGKSYSSFHLIKLEIADTIIAFSVIFIAFFPLMCNAVKKVRYLFTANQCSYFFSAYKTPIINPKDLPMCAGKKNKEKCLKSVRSSIRLRYLINCTFEKHDGTLKIVLAKKIVKDKCPSCGGPIIGAADVNYKCKYCGNMIMDVISKK